MLEWIARLIHIETIFFAFIFVLILFCIFTRDSKVISKSLENMIGVYEQKPLFDTPRNNLPARWSSVNIKKKDSAQGSSFQDTGRYQPVPKKGRRLNYHEEKCRAIFEKLFRRRFPTVRPDWLKNPTTGYNLELDGFCQDLTTPIGKGLAFEYDGIEHAKFSEHFHRNGVAEFEYQIVKDRWKDVQCQNRGVLLIRIPHYVTEYDLEPYIKSELQTKGVKYT